MENIDKIILDCIKYIRKKTDLDFVIGGSYGLYIYGILLDRDFHDIDIKFLDISLSDAKKLNLHFKPKIDILPTVEELDLKYEEVEFHGEKVLVFTPETTVEAKKNMLDFLENRARIITPEREIQKEKLKHDLEYLKEKYNLG